MTRSRLWRAHLAGGLIPLGLGLQGAALGAPFVPDTAFQLVATLARMADSLVPHLLALSLLPAALLAMIAYRKTAILLGSVALLGGLWTVGDYARMRAPQSPLPETQHADLTVLWFNLLYLNSTPPARIITALQASGADVILLTEATPLQGALDDMADLYPYRIGCVIECDMVILSRHAPLEMTTLQGGMPSRAEVKQLRIAPPGHRPVSLLGVHMLKPWYLGFTLGDDERLFYLFRRYKGPVVMAGDFNAAPWSRRMRQLVQDQKLGMPPHPVGTWPARLDGAGIPIDHVMVRGGVRFIDIQPWGGAALGSNHRGLLARLDLPE